MKFINRCVITLKPKTAFIDWVTSLDAELPQTWDFEGGAYLFDEHESEESLLDGVSEEAHAILENEFSVWTEDEDKWPVPRDFATLKQLFTLHIAVAGFDLGKEPLLRADVADLL
ncbi:hypothetical protein [Endozoicomonas sp. GU-1]|uniref:hypothetical protein n=1 Tax=Endozoicomonas sp. GU-1 TaxID=3009078 RepID=UPI0022B3C9FC|nr:hypothetical protein [Endozoicomonas sp. GU-1]WBA81816.1 hypothetical protein O2T12_01190 [Endozoicomonas sp. GU-1]WBA84770.1 hypothetical protein O3276_15990 [Endozoicomonas sp. GU-1]